MWATYKDWRPWKILDETRTAVRSWRATGVWGLPEDSYVRRRPEQSGEAFTVHDPAKAAPGYWVINHYDGRPAALCSRSLRGERQARQQPAHRLFEDQARRLARANSPISRRCCQMARSLSSGTMHRAWRASTPAAIRSGPRPTRSTTIRSRRGERLLDLAIGDLERRRGPEDDPLRSRDRRYPRIRSTSSTM